MEKFHISALYTADLIKFRTGLKVNKHWVEKVLSQPTNHYHKAMRRQTWTGQPYWLADVLHGWLKIFPLFLKRCGQTLWKLEEPFYFLWLKSLNLNFPLALTFSIPFTFCFTTHPPTLVISTFFFILFRSKPGITLFSSFPLVYFLLT